MFKHILLPTDGSKFSEKSVKEGVRIAKTLTASVTGLHVIPKVRAFAYQLNMLESTEAQYSAESAGAAGEYLGFVQKVAKATGVECNRPRLPVDHTIGRAQRYR